MSPFFQLAMCNLTAERGQDYTPHKKFTSKKEAEVVVGSNPITWSISFINLVNYGIGLSSILVIVRQIQQCLSSNFWFD
jgi:hypothetical protein